MLDKIKKLDYIVERSAYNKTSNIYNIDLHSFKHMLLHYGKSPTEEQIEFNIERFIPDFQRSNKKWNKTMQESFIINLLSGIKTKISLFSTNELHYNCKILDGLQRTTTIVNFIDNKFPILEDIFYEDLLARYTKSIKGLSIEVLEFKNIVEVIDAYIQLNENITHSKKDILKAKDLLKKYKEGLII